MSGRSHANTSRGLRHIKKYLGEDAERLARSNRAADVVPVLQKRQRPATTAAEEGPLSAEVLAHVRASCPNAAKKLSTRQTRLVESLADVRALRRLKTDLTHESSISIKRVHLESIEAMSDAIAIASIQRQWSAAAGSHEVAHAHAVEGASLCVLVDDHDAAVAMQADLAARYPCATVALLDADATTSSTDEEAMTALRFPTFPLGDAPTRRGGQSPRRRSPSPTRGGAGSEPRSPPSPTCPESESVASCAIVLITPAAFVAVDRRSAIWKFFGAFVVILSRHNSALLQLPMSDAHHDVLSMPQLSAHRWSCLGHVAVAAVLSTTSATLTAPRLDWLTTHRPTTNNNTSSSSANNTSLSPTKDASISPNKAPVALAAAPLAASRREVRIHYAALDGMPRFLLLFSLIKGLVPGRGLVVHVATKAMAAYLYEALYALDAEVPSFVRLLTDYDGASSLSVVQSPEGRAQLIHVFAEVVSAGRQTTSTPPSVGAHTSAVLISCYGIVPPAGDVFVCYDIIPDVPNFGLFVADSLTPGAVEQPSPAANNNNNNNDTTTTGQRETKAHKRTRCHSPIPLIGQDGESPRGSQQHTDPRSPSTPNNTDQHSFSSSGTLHNYSFIILLLRTNEMSGALRHLRAAGKRLHITYTPLEARQMPSVARFRLVADKMQSLHQKMFSIQNLAYSAYKDTMTAYATVGPRDVYDERNVSLEKVAEEFGFTEVPLLDLRLRDTPFRPKEDYFKAAQKKAVEERRRYRSFADQHIIGEAPEPHEVDEEPQE